MTEPRVQGDLASFISSNRLRTGPWDDTTWMAPGAAPLVLNSMSGADIQCHLVMPDPPNKEKLLDPFGVAPADRTYPAMKTFAELQTITISSARSVSGVRRLGEVHTTGYVRGGRTIAGTLVFTTFSRDVFAEFYQISGYDNFSDPSAPFFVDQIPPFHILMTAHNEYGVSAQCALINVELTNFGTTLSIHDIIVESTYSYVAQFYYPFVQDYYAFDKLARGARLNIDAPASGDMNRGGAPTTNEEVSAGVSTKEDAVDVALVDSIVRRLSTRSFPWRVTS